jgi:hypothetical protein
MRIKFFLKAAILTASLVSASGPVLANVYDIYVPPNGDVVIGTSFVDWKNEGIHETKYYWPSASPNAVDYQGYPWAGYYRDTSLSFPAVLFTVPVNEIQTASFNYNVLSVGSLTGRDDVATFSGGGSVLVSNGTGWQSFDITNGLKESLATSPASINYYFYHTEQVSVLYFFSADDGRQNSGPGADPAFIRITTADIIAAVPEPETYAMMLAGLGVMGAVVRRLKAKHA